MDQITALDNIGKGLSVLTYRVSQENLAGQFSKNRIIEDLLLPIFKRTFSAPNLRNLNTAARNNPYLDLADDSSRLGIQVTTERTPGKITETLQGLLSPKKRKGYARVIFFLLQTSRPTFATRTLQKWSGICKRKLKFEPKNDIVSLPELLSLIQSLPYSDIMAVRDIVAKSIVGEEYIDVLAQVRRVSEAHLKYEKKTGRYIPGVFVETREMKQLCRCFCHPALFFSRSVDSMRLLGFPTWNRFMDRAGLPPLAVPDLSGICGTAGLQSVEAASAAASTSFLPLLNVLRAYHEDRRSEQLRNNIPPIKRPFFDENVHVLRNDLHGLSYTLDPLVEELRMPSKHVFMLTGRAGQGKTNLLCDFVENFLFKHDIPCAFLSARALGLKQGSDLAQTICDHLFEKKLASLAEAARLLSTESLRSNKPFVLIIDGLNEHRDIQLFSQQLELVVDQLLQYPGIRCLFSCRSEFFDLRFSNFTTGHLASEVFLGQATETRLDPEEREELIKLYFAFFGVDGTRVAEGVQGQLAQDTLLLRFFCETYGSRGKDPDYVQPAIPHLYRGELFALYLSQKLQKADRFFQTISTAVSPLIASHSLRRVLDICLEHMISTGQFGNVPTTLIPDELQRALYSLLDEELIIRRDPAGTQESGSATETINFTFDEFRDYMLAQYLVCRVFQRGESEFAAAVAKIDPERSQSVEGLKRFLFYASRKDGDTAFHDFYKDHAWYADAYPSEVFNLDPRQLATADRNAMTQILQKRDYTAAELARQLAVRWSSRYYPVLNIQLLMDFVKSQDRADYEFVFLQTFVSSRYGEDRSILAECCKFVGKHVTDLSHDFETYRELLQFLALLLPARSTPTLDSPAFTVLEQAVDEAPESMTEILLASLEYEFDDHKPFVWRLLHDAMLIRPNLKVLAKAEEMISAQSSLPPGVLTEVQRTIGAFEPTGGRRR